MILMRFFAFRKIIYQYLPALVPYFPPESLVMVNIKTRGAESDKNTVWNMIQPYMVIMRIKGDIMSE